MLPSLKVHAKAKSAKNYTKSPLPRYFLPPKVLNNNGLISTCIWLKPDEISQYFVIVIQCTTPFSYGPRQVSLSKSALGVRMNPFPSRLDRVDSNSSACPSIYAIPFSQQYFEVPETLRLAYYSPQILELSVTPRQHSACYGLLM